MHNPNVGNDIIPGGHISNRPLYLFWLIDSSWSMRKNGKIEAVNEALLQALPIIEKFELENPFVKVMVQLIQFSTGAHSLYQKPLPISEFQLREIRAKGRTELGACIDEFSRQLELVPNRAMPPVAILLTDGHPTDSYKRRLNSLLLSMWGEKSIRLAISVGDDTFIEPLQRFIANPEIPVLQAHNVAEIIHYIKLTSTTAIKAASSPKITPLCSKSHTQKTSQENYEKLLW